MRLKWAILYSTFAIVFCLATCAIAMTVNVQPYGDPQVQTFDPEDPPPNLKDFDGDAECNYEVDGKYSLSTDGKVVAVSNLTVDLSGYTKIRLPDDADPNLIAHENGHDELNKFEYERYAKGKIEKAFEGFEGKRPIPDGNTPQQVAEQIKADYDKRIDAAKAAIKQQLDELSARYDDEDLTNHGKNTAITAADAVKKVKEEKEKGTLKPQEVGKNVEPDESGFKQVVTGQGAVHDANAILWSPQVVDVNNLKALLDTINGKGRLEIGEIIPLGPVDESDETGCSDSHLRVFDAGDVNNIFFDAGLYNVRILPSNKPGYSQMIQAYLNIWQIDNAIGSEFLAFMQQAQLEDQYTSFWFYATDRLVDDEGNWVAAGTVPGQIILGVATNADVEVSDDFESYDPISFNAAWLPSGGAATMLEMGMAHTGEKAMRMMVNNPGPMTSSQAMHLYPVPQDFSGEGRTLDISMRLEMPGEALDSFYVVLRDVTSALEEYAIAYAPEGGHMTLHTSDSDWLTVSIDLQQFAAIDTAHISEITVGFFSETEPLIGGVIVDDILAHDRRQLVEIEADLYRDRRVDIKDLAVFCSYWLEDGNWPPR